MFAIAQKAVTVSVTLATIMWSVGLPFIFPQTALAAGLTAIQGAGGPPNGQMGAPVEAMVDQAFSEALNESTVNTTNVTLKAAGGGESAGAQTGDNLCTSVSVQGGNRIVCDHAVLTKEIWYTFTVTTGVQGLSTATLSENFVSSFKTGSFGGGAQFNPPPFVTGSIPNGGSSLPANGKIIINFSSVMKSDGAGSVLDADNIGLYLVTNGVPGTTNLLTDDKLSWSSSNKQLKITPPTLTVGNNYRVVIQSDNNQNPGDNSCGGAPNPTAPCVMNTDGLAFMGQPFMIDFRTVAADVSAPAVTGSFPDTAATGVDRAQADFSISFNKSLDPATASSSTVELYRDANEDGAVDGGDAQISGITVALDPDGRVIHLSSNQILAANTKYIIRVKGGVGGVADTLGNTAAGDISIRTFTAGSLINGAAADTTAPQVMFASADNFSIAVTFSEAMKFNATSSAAQATSSGANDVNNLANWTLETAPTGNVTNWMQTPLTGKQVSYEPYRKTLMIMNLAMPPGGNFRLTATSTAQDLSSNGIDAAANKAQGTVKSSYDTGGMLGPGQNAGPVNFFNMGMKPINVSPMNAMAGATSRYRVEFPADQAIGGSGKITFAFPTGFSFAAACNTWPTTNFENSDINGPATGTVTVNSIACSSVSGLVTVTLNGTGIQAGDMVRFEMEGIVNSTVPKDFSSSGYTVDIKTYNSSNMLLESKTTMPFFITAPGARTITGTVFNDNGAGGGTANDGVKNGTEAGVAGISVCMGGPGVGFQCENTAGDGTYDFTGLNNGFYHVEIPPITSGAYTGGPFFRDLNINGSNAVENFGVKQASTENILDVYISGSGLDGTKLDVFAFSSAGSMNMGPNSGPGGSVVRECMVGGGAGWTNCNAVSLPLTQGKWQVGVGPWMPKGPGAANSMPDFNFMPPRSVEVEVGSSGVPDLCTSGAGAAKELCFDLVSASNQIKGKVTDGANAAIQNAFVSARPAFMNDANGPANGGGGQTDSAGLFAVKVITGTYLVDASMPGMPPSNSTECTVKADTGNVATDGNATADVYCNGNLITIANPLIFKLAKGGTSISGRVLDDANNPIPFAHVQGMEVNDSGNPIGGWADAPTDNTGNYTLYVSGGVSPATKKWKLKSFAPGFGELPSLTVAVTEGTNLTDKNLQATAAGFGTVTGTVTRSGSGVQGVFVGIHGPNGGNGTVTDNSGNYTLKVSAGSGYIIDGFVPGQGPTSVLTNITVTGGATATGKNLVIAPAGQITAYVCVLDDPLAAPSATNNCASRTVSTAFVDARDASGQGNGTNSNPTPGQYDLMIPAGTYTVFSGDPMIGPIGNQTNVVVAAGTVTYVNIVPPALYQVSGTVASSNSACIEGSTVFMTDKTNGRVILSRVDASGNWSQASVPSGTYSIGAGKPGCVDNADPGTLAVNGANVTAEARTLVKANATISGSVTLGGANVTFPTMVFATSGSGKMAAAEVDNSQTTGVNYTLNLTAGTWSVKARSDGSESSVSTVTVADGGAETQNLALTAMANYTRKEPRPFTMKPSQGGIVTNSEISSGFQVNIPAGVLGTSSNDGSVLTKETTSVIDTGSQKVLGGKGIEITPKDASGQPITTLSSSSGTGVTVTIPYTDDDVTASGGTEGQIVIASWSDEKQQWDPLPTTCDAANNTCTATTSHFSTFATIVATGGGAPSTPSGLAATAATSAAINLSWTQTSGATSYDIYRSTSSNGTFSRLGSEPTVSSGSTVSYGDTGLTANTAYYYKISALNASGESAASSAVSATTLSASSGNSGSISGGSGTVVQNKPKEVEKTLVPEKPLSKMTRAEIIAKISQIKSMILLLQKQLLALAGNNAVAASGIPAGYKFNSVLRPGMTSDDVKYLQLFLKSQGAGIYPEGLATGFYGPATQRAVAKLQEKFAGEILAPFGMSAGTGIAGSNTLAKINSLLGK